MEVITLGDATVLNGLSNYDGCSYDCGCDAECEDCGFCAGDDCDCDDPFEE